jgi:hypothetical protein
MDIEININNDELLRIDHKREKKEHGQDFACFGKHYSHPYNKNIIVCLFVPCAMMFVLTSSKPNCLAHFLISLRMIHWS